MDEEKQTNTKHLIDRLGARNYQQLALLDKKMLIEGQTSELLYQQKDYIFHQISIDRGLQIKQFTNLKSPKQLIFTQFNQLNDYLLPPTWNLEIVGASLSGKTQLLRDLAYTMSKLGSKVFYVSVFDSNIQTDNYKSIQIEEIHQIILILSIILENHRDLGCQRFYDGLSSLLYQSGPLSVIENIIEELHELFNKLQNLEIQVVVTSIAKSKDIYYKDRQDQFINQEKLFQKTILNPPWNMIWDPQKLEQTMELIKTIQNFNTLITTMGQ